MASLSDLQNALVNAHAAGDTDAATALANEIVRQQMPWAGPQTNAPIQEGPLSHLPAPAQAAVLGAGRTGSQIEAGTKQALLSGLVAGQQALGMDNASGLADLNKLDQIQKSDQPVYDALKRQYPIGTNIGESLPAIAIPMGQPTMAARMLAPALGLGAMEGAQYGSPLDRTVKAGLGFASGLVGGGAGEAASRIVQPIRDAASTPAQLAAKAAASKIGAPLLPSQQTGSPDLARIEDALARFPGSAGVMQDFLGRQQGAVNAAASRAVQQTDPLTQQVRDAAKRSMGGQYDAFRAQIPNGLPASQDVFDAITQAETRLSAGSKSGEGKQAALGMLSELKDKLYNTKALTPEEYSSWVSDLSTAARSAQNPQVSAALKGVGAKMDQVARGPLNPEWQKLDQAYAALKVVNTPGVTDAVSGNVSPVKVANILERKSTGARATDLADVAQYARAVPMMRAGSPTAERDAVSLPGLANALWRYPLAKMLTSDAMREYLARGLLASPEASGLLAGGVRRAALPVSSAPAMGLLGTLQQAYQ